MRVFKKLNLVERCGIKILIQPCILSLNVNSFPGFCSLAYNSAAWPTVGIGSGVIDSDLNDFRRRKETISRQLAAIRSQLAQAPIKIAAYERRVEINDRNIESIRRELSKLTGTIGNYENQLKITKESAERISATITNLKSKLDGATTFLKDELAIINEWKADVDSVKASIEDIPSEDVPILRDVFVIGIDDLQDSAQKFLDRPDDVFGDDDESPDFDQL